MKLLLNKTRNTSERYYLIDESMGGYGCPDNHANTKYSVANGIDKGNGYQGYSSVSYFLTQPWAPKEAKDKIIAFCKENNLSYNA